MRFASKRCSARTPARDVMSALGRSVDVRDSMENMVSVMIGPLVPSAQTKMDQLVGVHTSAAFELSEKRGNLPRYRGETSVKETNLARVRAMQV